MNPNYTKLFPLWQYADDCFNGVAEIKSPAKREKYLHMFPSERDNGQHQYELRCKMADYDNIFRSAISSMVGIMGKKEPIVKFDRDNENVTPQEVKDINVWGNKYDDRLTGLKARLNHAQVLFGRAGLLLDVVTDFQGLNPKFVIKEYNCYSILDGGMFKSPIDGKDRLKWVLLDESTLFFNPVTKTRNPLEQLRLLAIDGSGRYYTTVFQSQQQTGGKTVKAQDAWANFDIDKPPPNVVYPMFRNIYLPFVPFSVCNVDRIGLEEWQTPPFIDMAYSTINAYNTDSIHKLALANHARPTLVVSNAKTDAHLVLGGLLKLESPAGTTNPAHAQILETTGAGLNALATSVEKIKSDAMRRTIQGVLDSVGANTSGTAIALRTAAGTATIGSIDRAGARAIEEQLCFAAVWAGATWDEAGSRISFEVDTSYMENDNRTVSEFVGLMAANIGADGKPLLSRKGLYRLLQMHYQGILPEWADNEIEIEMQGDTLLTQELGDEDEEPEPANAE